MIKSKEAKYIWFNNNDVSRNPYAAFRKTFEIDNLSEINDANFNIFADTNYKLYINGKFIGFGPVRFDPKYPQFDTYNLKPFLQIGKNVIAVIANFHGHKTFKNVPEIAAMIAWGNVGNIDLSTNNQNGWKCEEYKAYSRYTPKLSFALNAQIFYDQEKFDENWINSDYNDNNWKNAVELKNQNHFGKLLQREIPFMSLESMPIKTKTKIFPINNNENLYSFYMELPFTLDTINPQKDYKDIIEWNTYIYSPCKQDIISSVLYDTVLVNGVLCEPKTEDDSKPLRWNFIMKLNEGWNEISGNAKIYQDIYECYLSLPKNKGLILSADKDKNSGNIFNHTKITLKNAETEWVYSTMQDKAESPCREASWDSYDGSVESISPDKLNGFIFKKSLYSNGFTLIFDMDFMHLVFPTFTLKGVNGATIDLLYSDRFTGDNKHVRQQSWVPLADRLVCGKDNDSITWSPVQPRGFKYLNMTVRNISNDIIIENLDFLSGHYPVEKIGSFECSDITLNKIWDMCARTQAVNMEDAYDDCVDRERGLYALDTLIQYHNNLACFGDHKLMKRSLELYAQSIHPSGQYRCIYPNTGDYILPDFSLYIVEGFYDYYLYTGDKNLIKTWWDSIRTNMNVFNTLSDLHENLLLNADPNEKIDPNDKRTGHLGDGGCTNNKGINCIFSCLYLIALRGMQYLAKEIGQEKDFEDISKRIIILEKSIPAAFWNEEKGLFSDNTEMQYFSPHASLFAVRANVVDDKKLKIIQKTLIPLLDPFFKNGYDGFGGVAFTTSYGYYMFDSLFRAGMHNVAIKCMKDGWGWFLSKGLKTTPEHFTLSESQCHAWTSSPVYILSRYILGINFDIKQGINNVTIDIKESELNWAKGIFPHPLGEIKINWQKDENSKIIIKELSAPNGVTVTVK